MAKKEMAHLRGVSLTTMEYEAEQKKITDSIKELAADLNLR